MLLVVVARRDVEPATVASSAGSSARSEPPSVTSPAGERSTGPHRSATASWDPIATRNEPRAQAARSLSGDHWARIAYLRRWFDETLAAADGGHAPSMIELKEVFRLCETHEHLDAPEDLWNTVPSEVFQEWDGHLVTLYEDRLAFLWDDCKHVQATAPEGMSFDAWRRTLFARALATGDPVARLFADRSLLPPEQPDARLVPAQARDAWWPSDLERLDDHERIALTNAALRTLHPMAFEFLDALVYRNPDPQLRRFLHYTECKLDRYCDLEIWLQDPAYGARFYARDILVFDEALERLRQRVREPAPLPIETMALEPFERPDGSFSFEGP